MSTYSNNLKLELVGNGEQSGVWGITTNRNLGTALEQAIGGKTGIIFVDADTTLTLTNTNAAQSARALVLEVTSSVPLTVNRNLIVPTIQKPYVVANNTTGGRSIVVKTAAGTGVEVAPGKRLSLYADGVNVVRMTTNSDTSTIIVGDSAPSAPTAGDLWLNASDVTLNVWYVDVNTSQWVTIAGSAEVVPAVDGASDLFIGGVDYTVGVTTQLTMSVTPASTTVVQVFFNGLYQNKDTWSRIGSVITFDAPIAVGTVEIRYNVASLYVGLDPTETATLVAAQNAVAAFNAQYLGAKATAPTLDNAGLPIIVGATYFNSTQNRMYVRNASNVWQLEELPNQYSEAFTGNGVTTAFSLSRPPIALTSTFVHINGVKQHTTTLVLAGSTITVGDAPETGDAVEVMYWSAV